MTWSMTPLGVLTTKIGSGATPRGGASVYTDRGTLLIRSQNVLDNRLDTSDAARISESAAEQLRSVSVAPGDVLINITGDSVARAAWVCEPLGPARVNQHVAIIRTGENLDPLFLQKYLVAPEVKDRLLALSQGGATRKALTKAMLANFAVPVPPLPTQRAIAEVLGALDDKIAANDRIVSSADRLAEQLTQASLVESRPLEGIAQVVMGSSPRGESFNEAGEGVEFYQGVRDFGPRNPVRRVFTVAPVKLAQSGDVLLSVRAPVGTVNRVDREVCIGRGLAAIRSTRLAPNALFHSLRNAASVWAPFNNEGTVFGSINQSNLRRAAVPWADRSTVGQLEQELSSLEARIDQAVSESARLAELRDTLLPHLMSGRITVREAEQRVDEAL